MQRHLAEGCIFPGGVRRRAAPTELPLREDDPELKSDISEKDDASVDPTSSTATSWFRAMTYDEALSLPARLSKAAYVVLEDWLISKLECFSSRIFVGERGRKSKQL